MIERPDWVFRIHGAWGQRSLVRLTAVRRFPAGTRIVLGEVYRAGVEGEKAPSPEECPVHRRRRDCLGGRCRFGYIRKAVEYRHRTRRRE